ncbi:MAG TPA: hypothetical protein VIJ45_06465, partial [Coriobacteriia bacterium]
MSFFMANPRYYAATRATPFRRRDRFRAGGPTETGRLHCDLEDDEVREGCVVDDSRSGTANERTD